MDENLVSTITYKQWVSVDRSTLEMFCKPADDFVDVFLFVRSKFEFVVA